MDEVPRPPPGRLHVRVLGTPTLLRDGREDPLPAGRPGRLLAALVLAGGRPVPSTRLVDLVWEEDPPASTRAALHTTVNRARRALGAASNLLTRRPGGYSLVRDGVTVDAELFLDSAEEARRRGDVAAFDHALAWWRGRAWSGLEGALAAGEARRLEEERLILREGRAEALLREGRVGEAVGDLQVLVAEEPLRERAVGLLVRALYAAGNVVDALAAYQAHRGRLADELGLDPSEDLAALHRQVLQRAVDTLEGPHLDEPDSGVPDSGVRQLPVRAVELHGREGHIAAIRAMSERHRCVTVVGPGGVGKTSVAVDIALHQPPGTAVWWVDLAQVADPSGVRPALAEAMAARADPGGSAEEALHRRLRVAAGLLVLDNCEHLLGPVGDLVADLLHLSGAVRVLATSRERLGVLGEHVFPLPPLQLPAEGAGPESAAVPAVALFVERASAAAPELELDAGTTPEVVELVRALDGLPLAIELAAGRTGSVTLQDLRGSLTGRLDLLRSTSPRVPARHRTLTATIEWSFDLLTEQQKRVFTGLAVFAGTFDLHATESVLGPGSAAVVPELVDRSLVVRPGPTGPGRYRLLEMLRAFAADRLDDATAASLRRAHAAWAAELAARAGQGVLGAEEAHCAAVIEQALPDLRTAFRWAVGARDTDLAGALVVALHRWAYFRVRPDVLGWSLDALELDVGGRLPDILAVAAAHAWMVGRFEAGRRYAESAMEAAVSPESAARAHEALGDVLLAVGDLDAARTAYLRATDLAVDDGRLVEAAMSACGLLLAETFAARPLTDALARLHDLSDRVDNPSTLAMALYCEGEATAASDPTVALGQLARAVELADLVGCRLIRGVAMTAEMGLRARHGDLDRRTVERTCRAIEHWAGSGSENLFVTCLRNVVPLLGRLGAHRTVAELAATLAAHSPDRAPYGEEAHAIQVSLGLAREALGADFESAWTAGRARTTVDAARLVLTQLRALSAA